jgi:hypothetical protein
MQTRKGLSILVFGLVLAGSFSLFTACEKDKDGTDLDRYFSDNPYISDPRTLPESRRLEINPSVETMNAIGQKASFNVKGGSKPISWYVANAANGTIQAQGDSSYGIYTASKYAPNWVIVNDRSGKAGIATIQFNEPSSLSIEPSSVDVTATGDNVTFNVSGGRPPYTWSVASTTYGHITQQSSSVGTYTVDQERNNSVIVVDSIGKSKTADIRFIDEPTQPPATLTVTPQSTVLSSTNAIPNDLKDTVVSIFVSGGAPPFNDWVLSGTDIGDLKNATEDVCEFTINGERYGTANLSVTDSAGQKATATVEVKKQ